MNSALVIGYGSVGALHARVLEELGCDVAVVSAREEVHHRCFPDLSSALLRTAPDYVVVANETALHARTVRGVRDAGFLGVILVEKPVRDTSGEQIDAWAQPLYVGYNLRFHPALARLRREVEGVQIHAAEIRCGSYLPAWRSNRDYPSHPANTSNLRHGAYSPELREPRAQQIAEAIMAEDHTVPADTLGAVEIGRLEALIETLDAAIAELGLNGRTTKAISLIEMRLRASRRLAEWADRYGMTPQGRADWLRQLAESETLAETIRRRRQEARNRADQ